MEYGLGIVSDKKGKKGRKYGRLHFESTGKVIEICETEMQEFDKWVLAKESAEWIIWKNKQEKSG